MYYNVNDPIRNNVNPSKNSQKNKNIFQPNLKVFQSPSQQNQNLVYSNNNDYKNYSIKVNKAKNQPKEKVIEGDLNFNNKNVHHNRITNNQKPKKNRGKPTKSPVPLPKDYKLANYQKLFSNHHPVNNNMAKPKSAYIRKNNFMNNINNINNNNINKNILKPNYLGINQNFSSNKTYNAFNAFKKKLERAQSPLITSGVNRGINFLQKGQVKSRYVSKSPILSKGSIFNRVKMNIFGVSNNTPSTNTTLIQGELIQDAASGGKININTINKRSVNINANNPINQNNQINPMNFKPIYNSQNLKIESNNALLNIHPEPNNKEKDKDNILQKKNKERETNDNNLTNKTNKENTNNSNINTPILNNNNTNNQPDKRKVIKENKKDSNNNNVKKNNQRSQSTGITNPLQKESKDKDIEKEEKDLQQIPMKIKKEKEKVSMVKNQKKIIKIIILFTKIS